MSDRVNIAASPRDVVGKKVKVLRRQGWIPAIIYGRHDPIKIQIENSPLRRALFAAGATNLIDVTVGDETHTVLAREVQRHLTRRDLIHVDFLEVDLTATVTAEARIVAVGQSAPAAEGLGVATLALRMLEIECLPEALLDEVEVDLTLIQTPDDVIYVSDLVVPEGVTIIADSETVVARFEYVKEEEEEEEVDELFEPSADAVEVIGRDKEDEEEFED